MHRRMTGPATCQKETADPGLLPEPFIGRDLRPDMRFAALLREPDLFEVEDRGGDRPADRAGKPNEVTPCARS